MNAEELYEQYEFLAPATVHKMFRNPVNYAHTFGLEIDDLLQFARLGLWKACTTYTKEKETSIFRSFAIRNIRWLILVLIKRYGTKNYFYRSRGLVEGNKVEILSMSAKAIKEDDEKSFYDVIAFDNINTSYSESIDEKVTSKIEYTKLLNQLTEEEQDILHLKMSGLSYAEIGEKYGMTRQGIGAKVRKIKEKTNRYLGVVI